MSRFTDFAVLGGDGIFSNLINSINKHEEKEALFKIPICLIPGGSTNSLSMALGAKNVDEAVLNLIRGNFVNGDFIKVDFL